MKKLFKQLALFIVPILIFLWGLDYLVYRYLKNTGDIFGNVAPQYDLYEGRIHEPIVILGSSRAEVHIDPNVIKKGTGLDCYNLGWSGAESDLLMYRFREYCKYNPLPRLLVINLDMTTFSAHQVARIIRDEQLPFNLYNFEAYHFYDKNILYYLIPGIRYSEKRYLIYQTLLVYMKHQQLESKRYHGFISSNSPWDDTELRKVLQSGPNNVIIDSSAVKSFYNNLKSLQEKNVQVMLYYAPEHKSGFPVYKNREEVLALYQQIAGQLQIPFINYAQGDITLHEKYYYNVNHLNKTGADIFSHMILTDILRLFKDKLPFRK
ncbi:hypothetical protein [Edaphocola flava]|uniref:hypothetical protein n=1 Tax=Edaphocola flava TaxID=2499629 RepID=UPI00100A5291|nr:hypothetical protein [Edaphocola flava]